VGNQSSFFSKVITIIINLAYSQLYYGVVVDTRRD
jgi:hypothetical protein